MSRRYTFRLAFAVLALGLAVGAAKAEVAEGDGMGIVTAFFPERSAVRLGDSDVVPLSGQALAQMIEYVKRAGWPVGTKLLAKFDVVGGVIQSILVEGRLEP
jgi:hypothetical protein